MNPHKPPVHACNVRDPNKYWECCLIVWMTGEQILAAPVRYPDAMYGNRGAFTKDIGVYSQHPDWYALDWRRPTDPLGSWLLR